MADLNRRLQKLEQGDKATPVILIVEKFTDENTPQTVLGGAAGSGHVERSPDESEAAFLARLNPMGRPTVRLEEDVVDL